MLSSAQDYQAPELMLIGQAVALEALEAPVALARMFSSAPWLCAVALRRGSAPRLCALALRSGSECSHTSERPGPTRILLGILVDWWC